MNNLNDKIKERPQHYIYLGIILFTSGILLNFLTSYLIKPMLTESMGDASTYIGFPLSIITAFMALLGFTTFSTAMNFKKAANQKAIKRKNKRK